MSRANASNANPELAVIIPALNERDNLELLLPALTETLRGLGATFEIIVVDGGSSDGTATTAVRRGGLVVAQQLPGYGGALVAGVRGTTAQYVATMDADLSHRPVFLEAFWPRRDEADVLIASRYVPGGRAEIGSVRRILSRILNALYGRVLRLPYRDLSSGFRMYRREILDTDQWIARDFDILEEILVRAHTEGRRIVEVPFHYMARGSGRSHVRLIRFGWAWLKTLVRMRRLSTASRRRT
jgi:dolichol-phosphate mannosyltransferase